MEDDSSRGGCNDHRLDRLEDPMLEYLTNPEVYQHRRRRVAWDTTRQSKRRIKIGSTDNDHALALHRALAAGLEPGAVSPQSSVPHLVVPGVRNVALSLATATEKDLRSDMVLQAFVDNVDTEEMSAASGNAGCGSATVASSDGSASVMDRSVMRDNSGRSSGPAISDAVSMSLAMGPVSAASTIEIRDRTMDRLVRDRD